MLVSYLGLVIEKNKVVNLTRITNPSEAVTLHLVDSLLPLASNSLRRGMRAPRFWTWVREPASQAFLLPW